MDLFEDSSADLFKFTFGPFSNGPSYKFYIGPLSTGPFQKLKIGPLSTFFLPQKSLVVFHNGNEKRHKKKIGKPQDLQKPRVTTIQSGIQSETEAEISKWSKKCEAPPGIIFLKKHKTASTTFRAMSQNVYKYHGLQIEPQLIGPQGGCYPAKINEKCWPKSGHLDPIQGKSQIIQKKTQNLC